MKRALSFSSLLPVATSLLTAGVLLGACSDPTPAAVDQARSPAANIETASNPGAAVSTNNPALPLAELQNFVATMRPIKTRAGGERFTSPLLRDPRAVAPIMQRLATGADSLEIRAALIEALPRTQGQFVEPLIQRWANELNPLLKIAIVNAVARSPKAMSVIIAGLQDEDPKVRAESARAAERQSADAALVSSLVVVLQDRSPDVRAAGARALGILRQISALPDLERSVSDSDPEVRLQALRALERTSHSHAQRAVKSLPLAADSDARVSQLASRILSAN